jgi:protein-S-isoprenylcysteine O-methyltransferase Ste14
LSRAAFGSILFLAFLAACLFGAAGRVAWPMGWAVLGVFGAMTAASFVLAPPGLLRERAAPGAGVDRGDALLASCGFLGLYPGTLIVAGLDATRPPLALPVQLPAFAIFAAGYLFALWAVHVNPFFATFVRIQDDRGHRLVDTGPYAWLRHPGYAGALLAHLALPLALGSLRALVPAGIGVFLFVLRTGHEDRFLAEHLPGYREYQARTRWRLVPGVW